MSLPQLPYSDSRMKQAMLSFGGVDYTPGAEPGQWEETENVSCREYPALVPRESREVVDAHDGATALYVYDKIAEVIGTGFYYDGVYKCAVSPGRKQICKVGDLIVIYPDKLYYNIKNDTFASQELTITLPYSGGMKIGPNANKKRITVPDDGWVFSSTNTAGVPITGRGDYARPINPTVTLVDNSTTTPREYTAYFDQVRTRSIIVIDGNGYTVFQIDRETREYWPGLTRQYITLHFGTYGYPNYTELGTVGGWAYAYNTTPYTEDIDKVPVWNMRYVNGALSPTSSNKYLNELNIGDILRWDETNHTYEKIDYIDRTLYTDHYYYTEIRTKIYEGAHILYADMDTIVEQNEITTSDNLRLTGGNTVINTKMSSYGEKYIEFEDNVSKLDGKDITIQRLADDVPDLEYICTHNNRLWGVAGNKIYASAWGNPLAFTSETQTAADPWSTEIGEDGEWTGIVSYSGAILAFKEHVMYRIIGSVPDEYTVYTYNVEGIRRGCHKSAVILGEVLYYMGPGGVYAYAGSVPQRISANFGTREYTDAVGGTDGLKYYLSAKCGEAWDLHVLDVEKGIWLREDDTEIIDFVRYDGKLYALDAWGNTLRFDSGDETITWHVNTAKLYEDIRTQYINIPIEHHSYSRFVIRIELDAGSTFSVEISYDGGDFTPCYKQLASRRQTYIVPIVPRRCDQMRIRLSGEGFFRLRGIVRVVHGGSAL